MASVRVVHHVDRLSLSLRTRLAAPLQSLHATQGQVWMTTM